MRLQMSDRRKRLAMTNLVSAVLIGTAFVLAVVLHEAKAQDDSEKEMRKVAFIQAKPKPKPPPEPPKPKPPPPVQKKQTARKLGLPKKQQLKAPNLKVAKALIAPKEVPKTAEKPPEQVEEPDSSTLSREGTDDESKGGLGGTTYEPPPGATGEGGGKEIGPEVAPPPPPPPKPKPKAPKTLFLRADMPQPERLEGSDPAYTEAAKAAGIAGMVIILFKINTKGDVTDVKIIKNLPVLGDVCAATVKRWKFKPMTDDHGNPVNLMVKQPFFFKLEN
jgi:protein TonB